MPKKIKKGTDPNMPKFKISNRTTGEDLGVYEGRHAMSAIAACLRDAGYEATATHNAIETDAPGDMNLSAEEVSQ